MSTGSNNAKPGYLYVLAHPSDNELFKIGMTTRTPEVRLKEHNRNFNEIPGRIVKESGQDWEIKTSLLVEDVHWAEAVFWSTTGIADLPFINRIEVHYLAWATVEAGLAAVKAKGLRPPPPDLPDYVYAYRAWMNKRLIGRSIFLTSHIKSKFGKASFQCVDGHEWRDTPIDVANGKGCPTCGAGESPSTVPGSIGDSSRVCLLTNANRPEFIRILVNPEESRLEKDWEVHKYLEVDEAKLGIKLFLNSIGHSDKKENTDIKIDLKSAELAFKNMYYSLIREIATFERAKGFFGG